MDKAPSTTDTGWRYLPHVIIFCSSACVMVVELVAGRLTGRHMGTSLYTWTSIIGVVLAGMSIGNWAGGRMADRWLPRQVLGWLFLAASAACLSSLLLNKVIADAAVLRDPASKMSYPLRVFLSMLTIFLLPALALGTISPVTAKMALLRGKGMGSTIGSVYAWGAVGSIVGTFLTGFWLIAALGSMGVVIVVSAVLALIGLLLGPHRLVHAIWLAAVLALLWLSQTMSQKGFQYACRFGLQEGEKIEKKGQPLRYGRYVYAKDSGYQFIRVYDSMGREWGTRGRELQLDTGWHSFANLDDASHLEYAYEKIYGALTARLLGERRSIRAFFIGGGGYTFPRWVQRCWPTAECDVAEIDPMVVEACHEAMGLARDTTILTYPADARIAVAQLPADRVYDLIIGDAFNNELAVPWHLTTIEFHRQLRKHLKPDGVMLTNIIEDYVAGGRFLGAYVHTVGKVFKHVHVFCTGVEGTIKGNDNFIVLLTDRDDPELHEYLRSLRPGHSAEFPGSRLSEQQLGELAGRAKWRILTDDNAPVENLMAPVPR